jgi:hypothetical protein
MSPIVSSNLAFERRVRLLKIEVDGLLEKSPFFQGGLGSLKKID